MSVHTHTYTVITILAHLFHFKNLTLNEPKN